MFFDVIVPVHIYMQEESGFLSSADTSPALHAILEQLYEDLNSYSETSIAIDQFNSIELKLFPYYPNPPAVKDWMVPVALVQLARRFEDNWDLTMVKVRTGILRERCLTMCRFANSSTA